MDVDVLLVVLLLLTTALLFIGLLVAVVTWLVLRLRREWQMAPPTAVPRPPKPDQE